MATFSRFSPFSLQTLTPPTSSNMATFFLFLLLTLTPPTSTKAQQKEQLVPAMFIFGDSLIDNGNNNDLASFAKANYYPYGIDFSGGPTGRFSNGLTMADVVADLLGLPLIPAHSTASGKTSVHGLNYASAAAGILDNTGGNFVGRIPFNEQIKNFEGTLDQLTRANNMSSSEVASTVERCVFFVGMGSNDYLNNYLMPNFPTRSQYNPNQFADFLIQHYSEQLTRLYNLGGRRFVVPGVGSIGCTPNMLARSASGRCDHEIDASLVVPFNNRVRSMLDALNSNLPRSKFVYVDIFRMFQDLLQNYRSYGFRVMDEGCCGVGRNRGEITCLPMETPCPNRKEYVFWDAFHPTEDVNVLMARKAFHGGRDVAFPINIHDLVTLDISSSD